MASHKSVHGQQKTLDTTQYATLLDMTETVKLSDLTPHPDNPRQGDIGAIATSIQENGWYGTIVAQQSTGIVLAGNHRLQAAKQLGMTELPVYWVDVDDTTARKILLADNRVNDLASYDSEALAEILTELATTDDLLGTGYDGDDIDTLLGDLEWDRDEIDDPGPTEPPADPVTKPGDVIQLGNHRLVCGDAYEADSMPEKCDMVLTDPPYGMELDTDYTKMGATAKSYKPVIGDDAPFDMTKVPVPNCEEQFWFGAEWYRGTIPPVGGSWLVWDKRNELNDEAFGSMFEACWSKVRHRRIIFRYNWQGYAAKESNELREHPTQKPVALIADMMTRWSNAGGIVLDPFAGSGTTLIAAEQTGRICHAVELDPGYCDVIVTRWETATGKTAQRP